MTRRTLTVLLQFYRPLFALNFLFNLVGVFLLYANGMGILGNTLIAKITFYITSIGYQYYSGSNAFFYFRNAGYRIRRLFCYVFAIDFVVYILFIIIYYSVIYASKHT